jgi:hypothetical protein
MQQTDFEELAKLITSNSPAIIIQQTATSVPAKELLLFGSEYCLTSTPPHTSAMCECMIEAYLRLDNKIYLDDLCMCMNLVLQNGDTAKVMAWIQQIDEWGGKSIHKLVMSCCRDVALTLTPNDGLVKDAMVNSTNTGLPFEMQSFSR